MLDLRTATHESFGRCLHEVFAVEREALAPLELRLVSVETRGEAAEPSSHRRQGFCLIFRGPMTPTLGQSIRTLSNDTLGKMELFLVPVGPDESGMLYEAVFT